MGLKLIEYKNESLMKNNYEINLKFNCDQKKLEVFEKADNNLVNVKVYPRDKKPNGEIRYIISLEMTADAMLGMGTELIRKALYDKKNNLVGGLSHIHPMDIDDLARDYGVYLISDSAELMISHVEMDTIENMYNKLKEK